MAGSSRRAAVTVEPAAPPASREGSASDGEVTLLLFSGEQAERLSDLDDIPARLGGSKLLWIDVGSTSEETAARVAEELDLDDDARQALASSTASACFRDAGRFIHVTVHCPDGNASDALTEVECIVGENWVVTAHNRPVPVLDDFQELASGSGPTGELDGPSFLAALLQWVLNEYSMAFERLEDELEEFDERAMRGKRKPEDEIEELVSLRRRARLLKGALIAHRTPFLALTHRALEARDGDAAAERFQTLFDRYEVTVQNARDARESIVNSFDVLIARTGHRTNEIMKILTLTSVILLPGALLAGVMGMNFKVGLFDHAVVFWFVLLAMLMIAAVTLGVAKLRHWL
jgi:magnesium transporter